MLKIQIPLQECAAFTSLRLSCPNQGQSLTAFQFYSAGTLVKEVR